MTDLYAPSDAAESAPARAWTCPCCALLCDGLTVQAAGDAWRLAEGRCRPAQRMLARFAARPSGASPRLAGVECTADEAIAAAAHLLSTARQPLFGGLGTDVAGARALYRLACRCGAICDPAGGEALMHGVRTQQDRGGFGTTLAEVRNRADLIVCVGGLPGGAAADFFDRCGVGETLVAARHVVLLGGSADDVAALSALGSRPGVTVEAIAPGGDLFAIVALLAAQVSARRLAAPDDAFGGLATQLHAATYAVLVGTRSRLPKQGALIVETVNAIVAGLNRKSRAASLWLGSGDTSSTVNEVFTWLSGLPLRTRAGPRGLEHEPLCFDATRLLAGGAVDALLWVSAFDADAGPPATSVPTIVLGPPGAAGASDAAVFIPVSTPGIGSAGHLFRGDGGVVLPLTALHDDGLPTVAQVVARLAEGVRA